MFVAKPADAACLKCHRGDNVGWDYHGRAAREDHERYQRGATADGQRVLKMVPDVHQQKGMACSACHDVHTLHEGRGRVQATKKVWHPAEGPAGLDSVAHHCKRSCMVVGQ